MIKKFTYFFVLFGLFYGEFVFSQQGSSDPKPINSGEKFFSDYDNLRSYFLSLEKGFNVNQTPAYLYSVSHKKKFTEGPAPKHFRLTYDNLLMLNTHNFSVGLNPWKYDKSKFNAYLSGRVGWGYHASEFFMKNTNEKAKINSSFGIEAELEKQIFTNFDLFGGAGFNVVFPEKFNNTEKNSGTILDPFIGMRYYVFAKEGMSTKINLQARIGFPFTNGFTYENGDASSFYVGLGAGITSMQSLSKASELGFMTPEFGFSIAPLSGVTFAHLTQPVQLMENISLGFFGQIGTGYADGEKNNEKATSYYSFGADLRFFAYRTSILLNPYIGVMFNNYGYSVDGDSESGNLSFLRIGDKIKIGENSNWFVDINLAVPLTSEDNWIESPNENLSDIPSDIDLILGIIYKFKPISKKQQGVYKSRFEIYNEEGLKMLNRKYVSDIDPLPDDADADTLIEKRIYVQTNVDTVFVEVPVDSVVSAPPEMDITNIRLGRYVDPNETTVTFDDWSIVPKDTLAVTKKPLALMVVGIDSKLSEESMIGDTNMFLVFTDLNTSRLFGFTYDKNNNMKPEMKNGRDLKLSGNDMFYGGFNDYVIPLKWLDASSGLDYQKIKGRIPWATKGYKIAYAEYPENIFEKIRSVCHNFGVSIMFRYHLAKDAEKSAKKDQSEMSAFLSNMLSGDRLAGANSNDARVIKDKGYFSNCKRVDVVDDFILGSDKISQHSQKENITDIARHSMYCTLYRVAGYTDGIEFKPDLQAKIDYMNELQSFGSKQILNECPQLKSTFEKLIAEWNAIEKINANAENIEDICQRALSWRRIIEVLSHLKKYEDDFYNQINLSEVIIEPVGNSATNLKGPNERKVELYFKESYFD